jgi:hypothetical protein
MGQAESIDPGIPFPLVVTLLLIFWGELLFIPAVDLGIVIELTPLMRLAAVLFILAGFGEVAVGRLHQGVLIAVPDFSRARNVGLLAGPVLLHRALATVFVMSVVVGHDSLAIDEGRAGGVALMIMTR